MTVKSCEVTYLPLLSWKKLSYYLWLKALRDSKVRAAKDHGIKLRSYLPTSFKLEKAILLSLAQDIKRQQS